MKRLLALLLTLGLMVGTLVPVSAEETPTTATTIPLWAYGMLADGYAMGLFGDEIYTQYDQVVTQEQIDTMTKVVGDKLALLGVAQRAADTAGLVLDTTRGGVANALYQEAAAYAFPGGRGGT